MALTGTLHYGPIVLDKEEWRVVLSVAIPVSTVLLTGLLASGGTTGRLQRMINFERELKEKLDAVPEADPLKDAKLASALGKLTRARVSLYVDRFTTTKPAGLRDLLRMLGGIFSLLVTAVLMYLWATPEHDSAFSAQVWLLIGGVLTGILGAMLLGPTAHRLVIGMVRSDYIATLRRLEDEVYQQDKWPKRSDSDRHTGS